MQVRLPLVPGPVPLPDPRLRILRLVRHPLPPLLSLPSYRFSPVRHPLQAAPLPRVLLRVLPLPLLLRSLPLQQARFCAFYAQALFGRVKRQVLTQVVR